MPVTPPPAPAPTLGGLTGLARRIGFPSQFATGFLAILNLGAGLGAFVGPGVVTLLLGDDTTAGGYLWVALALAGLYVISFGLCFALKLPGNARVLTAPPAIEDSEEAPGQDHRHSLAPVQALGAAASSLPAGAA